MRGWSFVTVDCVGGMATCYTGAGLAYRYFLPVAREAWECGEQRWLLLLLL